MSEAERITRRRKWSVPQKAVLLEEVEAEATRSWGSPGGTASRKSLLVQLALCVEGGGVRDERSGGGGFCASRCWVRQAGHDGHCLATGSRGRRLRAERRGFEPKLTVVS